MTGSVRASPLRAAARRVHEDESGMTLIELLTVLAILVIVIGGLTTMFSAAITSEKDQTTRVQGQTDARVALSQLRREIHCATTVSPNPNGTWPTQSVTITLGSYCPTNTANSASVTWCTSGSGPYTLWRYPHTTDLSSGSYAAACTATPAGSGRAWIPDVVNAGSVTAGQIFSNPISSTPPSMAAPALSYGTAAGSLGSVSAQQNFGYIVDPVTATGEWPGTENLLTIPTGTTGKSILLDWSLACSVYPSNGSITSFKVYGRTFGQEQLLTTVSSSGCATTTYTDVGAVGTPPANAASPVGATRSKITVDLPVRADSSSIRLIELKDDIVLRNTPR
jgi:prepilin-type N-terminal cleavage/methylation domain-containing protein